MVEVVWGRMGRMKVLSISDVIVDILYSGQIKDRFQDVDLVISCGDLPYYYLEYIVSMLDVPLFYVRGNHANVIEYGVGGPKRGPEGARDIHRRVINHKGLLLAGIEGCLRYKSGPFLYTQNEMWGNILSLVPQLLINRVLHGRFLDIFVSHAPPWGIHDQEDIAHQGIKAFCWLLEVFKPTFHLHGHIHVYHPFTVTVTKLKQTYVINSYGFRETDIQIPPSPLTT